ncbi:MAG: hypothetical protein OEQ25_18885, partial [Gammaproteobacteria bacterium]|nr:hypothetical protein [Gammaproteobacteria bacterium]
LGNALDLPDCDYQTADEVRDALKQALGDAEADNSHNGTWDVGIDVTGDIDGELDVPIYSVDAVVRRAAALQNTQFAGGSEDDEPTERAAGA